MKRRFFTVLGLIVLIAACKPKEGDFGPSAGDIDPTRFISIGGSVTAGFLDDALTKEGQENSLGNILATQLKEVGLNGYTNPFISNASVGINLDGKSALKLGYKTDCEGVTSLSPVRLASSGDAAALNTLFGGQMHNFGVPYLKSIEISKVGYGDPSSAPVDYNPFYGRMAYDQANSSVLDDAISMNPTFFSVFIGMDEVLAYAKKGAAVGSMTPVNGADGVGFDGSFDNLLSKLTQNGAKGVVGTIPDVTEMPYFTTIPYDGLDLDAASAQTMNEIYNPIGIYFNVGKNPFLIEDPSAGAFGVRKLEEGELILLSVPLDSVKCYKMGSVFPFRNEFILTNTEIASIRASINSYNAIIISKTQQKGLALVDVHSFYSKFKSGFVYNGISLSSKFVSGGAYSLDGIHLNPRANALLANEFIKAINTKYNAKIPLADATKYRGVKFP